MKRSIAISLALAGLLLASNPPAGAVEPKTLPAVEAPSPSTLERAARGVADDAVDDAERGEVTSPERVLERARGQIFGILRAKAF